MSADGALPSTQKAVRFHPSDRSIRVEDIPVPSIKSDELLVKVRCASLCHSDLMLADPPEAGFANLGVDPFVMGHEACGVVAKVGSDAKGFQKGDRIGWLLVVNCCYECDECQIHQLYCEKGKARMQGFGPDGYFQEYAMVKCRNAVHIPDGMDLTTSAPLFCAGTTAYNAATDTLTELGKDPTKEDVWVGVIGCGGLGNLAIQYLKSYGCKVVGVDMSDVALDGAKAAGADHVFNPKTDKDYYKKIRRQITTKGVHAAINFTDVVPAYNDAPKIIRYNGVLMAVGLPAKPVPINMLDISMHRLRLRGSNNGRPDQLQRCVDFSHKHGIQPVMEQYKLEQFHEILEIMKSGKQKSRMGIVFD